MTAATRILAACLALGYPSALLFGAPSKINFDRDIRPILSDNCFFCHGPDETHRRANLRLDTAEGALAARKTYKIITPGDSAHSRLYERISAENPAARMPPPSAPRHLNTQQIALIKQWIDEGAKYEIHWAYAPPVRPELPQVQNAKWVRNPIDNFILARLENEKLVPAPEADKPTLIRRVSLDLTGLPPTPAEVDAFLSDKSPRAYEKVVDRLLASPHYGERMASDWLDLARYSDTHGFHIDSHRDMWRWRDWVVSAFNHNMPYDEFTVDQIAGDLLPNATTEQKLATGFNRNHMINFEGGAIPEEYQVEYVIDRANTTATTWLGLTMGCARCHDHKYDPIKQVDFYRFYSFFNSIPEKGLDGKTGNAEPVMQLASADQQAELDRIQQRKIVLKDQLDPKVVDPLVKEWSGSALDGLPEAPRKGLVAHYAFDGNLGDQSGNYQNARITSGEPNFGDGVVDRALHFNGDGAVKATLRSPLSNGFSVALWINPGGKKDGEFTILRSVDAEGKGFSLATDDYTVVPELRYGMHVLLRFSGASGKLAELRTRDQITTGHWTHLTLEYDGSQSLSGVTLLVDGKSAPLVGNTGQKVDFPTRPETLQIGAPKQGYRGGIDDLRIYDRLLAKEEAEELFKHEPVKPLLAIPETKRKKEQAEEITEYFLTYAAPEPFLSGHAELMRIKQRQHDLDLAIPTVMVMSEMEKPRDSFVLGRGQYDNPKDKVSPGVPAFLPPLPKDAPANRLTLARWIVDPANPLPSRVAVNRYWQTYFGIGIVETAEDFGSQGELPSNPQLLDWLATEFVASKWNVKALQRLIVTSSTYRQAAHVDPQLLEKDPRNRLLARGARFRLSAEAIRDNALAVSGLLHDQIGGPGVFPYQPAGLWEELAFGDVYSAQSYVQSHGNDLYRRSLYTFIKRTAPPPSMATFDAPDREKCTARRTRTNTPLQALELLNDPTYVEAARALAQRMILEGGHDVGSRLTYGFRLAMARRPDTQERQVFRDLLERELGTYRKDEDAAAKLLTVGEWKSDPRVDRSELAAWTTVASLMLNMDETITRE